jgi:hypothetical protein
MRARWMPTAWLLGFFLSAAAAHAAQPAPEAIHLRVVAPKRYYRPGESITLELRCDAGLTGEVIVFFNPGAADEGGASHPAQKCPRSRFKLAVPKDFAGSASVGVLLEQRGNFHADRIHFEIRSDAKPRELWLRDLPSPDEEPSGDDACALLSYDPGRSVSQRLPISAILADGIRLDLCGEREATFRTDPAADFPLAIQNGSCTVTPRRAGSFRVTASFRGLTESWVCTVVPDGSLSPMGKGQLPSPPRPGPPMTAAEFLANPTNLRVAPTDVGGCRLVEHWTTGYCYVYSMREKKKVSEKTDALCADLIELRRRMKLAIENGYCR